eukprot:jgi/Botrbrau1/10701/Bobra.357_1s0005.1
MAQWMNSAGTGFVGVSPGEEHAGLFGWAPTEAEGLGRGHGGGACHGGPAAGYLVPAAPGSLPGAESLAAHDRLHRHGTTPGQVAYPNASAG